MLFKATNQTDSTKGHEMKKALITGVTGQDGAYLAELLLSKGYEVHGIKRRTSLFNTSRIDHLFHDIHEKGKPFYLHHGDMTDSTSLTHIIQKVQPDEMCVKTILLQIVRLAGGERGFQKTHTKRLSHQNNGLMLSKPTLGI